ncbi:MAG: hypothetical protein HGA29_04570 [Syntrophaceae bacterium]|nr:hypothetical protein [Syntrophaceae bacterium]
MKIELLNDKNRLLKEEQAIMQPSQSKKEESVDILRDEFLQERAAVLGRAGMAVEDVIAELAKLDQEIQIKKEHLQSLKLDEVSPLAAGEQQLLVEEINIDIEQFNVVIEKARLKYYYLIVTREAMGLRRHRMVQEMYVIPEKKKKIQVY